MAGTLGTVKEAWQIYVDKERLTVGSMTVAVEADGRTNRPSEQIESDIKREIGARLGFGAQVVCHPEGTLPRYEAKAIRVLHRVEPG